MATGVGVRKESVLGEAPGDAALVALPSGGDAGQGLSVFNFDFDSIDLPNFNNLDFEKLAAELSPTAAEYSSQSTNLALELARGAAEGNRNALTNAFISAMGQSVSALGTLSEAAVNANMAALNLINPNLQGLIDDAADIAGDATAAISTYLAANLPTMLENSSNLARKHDEIIGSLLAGEIPADVEAQIRRRAAESAGAHGVFGSAGGSAGRNLEARDLGLSSLQMQRLGAAMAEGRSGLWLDVATDAAAAADAAIGLVGSAMDLTDSLMPDVDVAELFGSIYATEAKATTIDPTQVFTSALDQYNKAFGWGVDVARGNQQAQAQYDSMMLQFKTDQMNATVAMRNADLAVAAQLRAAEIDAAATQNAATINANATKQAAWYAAAATIEAANATAKGNVDAAIGAASINKGKWDKVKVGTENVYVPAGPTSPSRTYRRSVYENRFIPATIPRS